MATGTIDEIKASVEVRIAQACEEAIFDTCSGFLYTLWLEHPEMDFSFFSEKAVEEMKRYTADVVKDTETSIPQDPFEVASPNAGTGVEVQPTAAATPPS